MNDTFLLRRSITTFYKRPTTPCHQPKGVSVQHPMIQSRALSSNPGVRRRDPFYFVVCSSLRAEVEVLQTLFPGLLFCSEECGKCANRGVWRVDLGGARFVEVWEWVFADAGAGAVEGHGVMVEGVAVEVRWRCVYLTDCSIAQGKNGRLLRWRIEYRINAVCLRLTRTGSGREGSNDEGRSDNAVFADDHDRGHRVHRQTT